MKKIYEMFIYKPFALIKSFVIIGLVIFMLLAPFITLITFANVEHDMSKWFIYTCRIVTLVDFIIFANIVIAGKRELKKAIKKEIGFKNRENYEKEER
jgi:hypothetical protein